MSLSACLRALPVLFGILYLIADANNIDFDYAWDHSVYPPFTDMNGNMHGWDYKALISSYNFVRLTSDEASQNGYIFSKQPFEASDWFVEFQTDIATTGRFAGDGMAFWFTERAYQPGQAFGHDEHFKGLGVFLDTYRNGDHAHSFPYVGAMVGDGVKRYHHENDGMGTLIGGCQAEIVNTERPIKVKIIYASRTLEVLLELNQSQGWTTCIKTPNVVLPKKGYIGFTAATGEAHCRHDIMSVTTARIDKGSAERYLKSQTFRMTEKKGSYFFFFLLLIAVAAAGYYYFVNNQKKTRF